MTRSFGIALLSVMIVIASVSATASWLLYRQHIDISRTSQTLEREQAFLFALALEEFADDLLEREVDPENPTPNRFYAANKDEGQWWSRTAHLGNLLGVSGSEAFQGVSDISIKIYDLQGFFSINNLRKQRPELKDWQGDLKKEPMMDLAVWAKTVIRNMLQGEINLEADSTVTHAVLFDSLQDWMDTDDSVRNDGAEDATYGLSKVPYHAANSGELSSMEELLFVNGFRELDRADVETLNGLLTSLPLSRGKGFINVNVLTATPRLLEYLIEPLVGKDQARKKVNEFREEICGETERPIADKIALKAKLLAILPKEIEDSEKVEYIKNWVEHASTEVLGITSEYFMSHIAFKYGGREFKMNTMFYIKISYPADDERFPVQVLHRFTGPDPYEGLSLHEGAGNCPPVEKDDEGDDLIEAS